MRLNPLADDGSLRLPGGLEQLPALEVLHADADLVIVNKPAKLLSVPGRGVAGAVNLWAQVRRQFEDALVVHRLDMATSGLMIFARGATAQRQLSMAFEQRKVGKRYVAVVEGRLEPVEGEVDAPLMLDWPNRPRQIVDFSAGKPSLTRWHVQGYEALEQATQALCSRVVLEPYTGRSHQLRLHMRHLGHPIVGDELYGTPPTPTQRLLLHASQLTFSHPRDAQPMSFSSPAPF